MMHLKSARNGGLKPNPMKMNETRRKNDTHTAQQPHEEKHEQRSRAPHIYDFPCNNNIIEKGILCSSLAKLRLN